MSPQGRRWWVLLALAASLRLAGLGYGLPAVFNGDEPHIVDIAVSFGGGSLNPHLFKYPTLWMYVLFFAYGVYYLLWSGFGLLRTVREFGILFAWHPFPFYFLGRLLAVLASVAAVERVYKAAALGWGESCGLWAAGILAVSPFLVESAHAAKPESLMFLLAAWAWWYAVRYQRQGSPRDLLLCGFMTGLSLAAQYTALPLVVLVPAVWWSRRQGPVWPGLAAVAAGFALGSPFVLLDFRGFWSMAQDLKQMNLWAGVVPSGIWRRVLVNVLSVSGFWLPGGLAFLAGAAALWREGKRAAVWWLAPLAAFVVCLSFGADGGNQRYLYAAFPVIAFVAAAGVHAARRRAGKALAAPAWDWVLLAALAAPGAAASLAYDRALLLPDTRTLAGEWIQGHLPPGTPLLIDQTDASPPVRPSPQTVDRLLAQTSASGHPRRRYYELLRAGHPGGGYAVYQIRREARDLWTLPEYAAFSEAGRNVLDVRSGVQAARDAGVEVVVLSSFGADGARAPELARFLSETERQGRLLADFEPAAGSRVGPVLRIYKIR